MREIDAMLHKVTAEEVAATQKILAGELLVPGRKTGRQANCAARAEVPVPV